MQAYALIAVIILTAVIFFSGMSFENPSQINVQAEVDPPTVRVSDVRPGVTIEPNDTDESVQSPDVPLVQPESVATEPDPLPPTSVHILTTQNVEYSSAKLRGEVVAGEPSLQALFFVYSYDQSEVEQAEGRGSYQVVAGRANQGLTTYRFNTNLNRSQGYYAQVRNLAQDTTYYAQLCAETVEDLRCSSTTSFRTPPRVFTVSDARVPAIGFFDVEHISSSRVELSTRVDMRDMQDGEVYVVYGESQSAVNEAWGEEYRDIDEDDDDLQRQRVASDLRGQRALLETVSGLDDETKHYYFWCVEYDGLSDGVVCSRVYTFTTHSDEFGQTPDVDLSDPSVEGATVVLRGEVDMDEFRNGRVFFVYGTDMGRVSTVAGQTSFNSLRQSGDTLQKRLVDSDLDRDDEYTLTVNDLLPNTTYAARLCVEYQNEDKNFRQSAFVTCSGVEEFVTE